MITRHQFPMIRPTVPEAGLERREAATLQNVFPVHHALRLVRLKRFAGLALSFLATGCLLAQFPVADSFDPVAEADIRGEPFPLQVRSLAVQADGKILVGGNFASLGGQPRSSLGRLNADGTVDTQFNNLNINGPINCMAVLPDGKIVVGGGFTMVGGQPRNFIARLNTNGTLDEAFTPVVTGALSALAVQTNGMILVAGNFITLDGQPRDHIGRFDADGNLDESFSPDVGGEVYTLALQPDGKILIGGDFSTLIEGRFRKRIARLNPDGSRDREFHQWDTDPYVQVLAVQKDGRILAGGLFNQLSGQPRSRIGRLMPEGIIDNSFNPGADGDVISMAIQADGKILVVGIFTTLAGQPRNRIGRLHADGTLDSGFDPAADNFVFALALQTDGKILVGGTFTTVGGESRSRIGRLNNTEPATQQLSREGNTIIWLRGGTSPEVTRTTFETSTNGIDWSALGTGTRIFGGWLLGDVSIPDPAYIRARGHCVGGFRNAAEWFAETLLSPAPLIIARDSSLGLLTNRFGFNILGPPNQLVIVDTSTDLFHWTPLQTNTIGTGPFYFSDPNGALLPHRFYRARTP